MVNRVHVISRRCYFFYFIVLPCEHAARTSQILGEHQQKADRNATCGVHWQDGRKIGREGLVVGSQRGTVTKDQMDDNTEERRSFV